MLPSMISLDGWAPAAIQTINRHRLVGLAWRGVQKDTVKFHAR